MAKPYTSLMGAMLMLIFYLAEYARGRDTPDLWITIHDAVNCDHCGAFVGGFIVATIVHKSRNRVPNRQDSQAKAVGFSRAFGE
ncbi:hypothetical protein CCP3SC1_450029 [Gammaproteobacteria bacterium]